MEDGDGHGFRITIPQNWVIDTWTYIDDLVTDPTNGDLESRAGMLFGAKLHLLQMKVSLKGLSYAYKVSQSQR